MMTKKGYFAVFALLAISLVGSHFSKKRLDIIRPEEGFREMMYLPSGPALKILACGFDAPLADFLWVKGQLYFSDNLRAIQNRHEQNARYRYVYKLHDVITDLAPRFGRAYTLGALYLLVTGKEHHAHDAIMLLKKGIAVCANDAGKGQPFVPDERWYMHLLIANTYDQNLDDLTSALAHYRLAADQPGCPPEVYSIIAGVEQQQMLGAGAIERYDVMIRTWESQLKSLRERGAVDDTLINNISSRLAKLVERRRDLVATREIEEVMSKAGKVFLEKTGHPATSLRQLFAAGLLKGDLKPPLHKNNDYDNSPEYLLPLPDGRVKSYILARVEADFALQLLFDSVRRFYNRHGRRFPGNLEQLVRDGILAKLPEHSLKMLGYRLTYNPVNGALGVYDPEKKKILPLGRETETSDPEPKMVASPVPEGMVRVAAIQTGSAFGKPRDNIKSLSTLIRKAARAGARIVVLPEAAITGYADMENEIFWADGKSGANLRDVSTVAEKVDGESVRAFSALAKELGIYLTAPFIEKDGGKYYVSVTLLAPSGKVALHHRKSVLWDMADGEFASPGPEEPPVADTPFGRIGIMICRDMHRLPEIFAGKDVDIVLHSAAFYGPNFEGFLMANKYVRLFREGGMHLVLANWTPGKKSWWQGYGMSRIMSPDGELLARAKDDLATEIVIADIPRKNRAAVLPKKDQTKQNVRRR